MKRFLSVIMIITVLICLCGCEEKPTVSENNIQQNIETQVQTINETNTANEVEGTVQESTDETNNEVSDENEISQNNEVPDENEISQNNEVPDENESSQSNEVVANDIKPFDINTDKMAIVYFSATGTTRAVAELINSHVVADLFEIYPVQPYTDEDLALNDTSRSSIEQKKDKTIRPDISNQIDVANADVVFLGYPIWYDDVPRVVLTFIESGALDGKIVVPFCTSGSSGITGSEKTLREYKNIKWVNGARLTNSDEGIVQWLESLPF